MRLAIACTMLALLAALALAGPGLLPAGAADPLRPPSWAHPLGTDPLGRDVAARIAGGARTSLAVALGAVLLSSLLGGAIGLAAGSLRGAAAEGLMRVTDLFSALPQIVLVLVIVGLWGGGSRTLVVTAIGLTTWMGTARLVRAETVAARAREFVPAARAAGATPLRVLLAHVLPHVLPVVLVAATLRVGGAILLETSLGYLGLGVPVEVPTWGRLVREGTAELRGAWWIAAASGGAIALATLAFNLLGDVLRDRSAGRA